MSGFITDTGFGDFQKAAQWVDHDREVRRKLAVDQAIRGGVGEMMDRGGSAAYQAPMGQPWQGSVYQPPMQRPAAPTPLQSQSFGARTAQVEGGGDVSAVNPQRYSGKYQFGTAALHSAGAYTPAPGESLRDNQWKGTVNLPSGRSLSHAEFVKDEPAQDEAWNLHQAYLGKQIDQLGLSRFIGQTIGGVPITDESLRAMMHIGGPMGTARFLSTGGAYNPADANGTTLSAYAAKVGGGGGQQVAAAPGIAGMEGGQDGMPQQSGNFNARYDPILQRLAKTPGGGATALSILGSQSRWDMAQGKRGDAYQRLAMAAFAKGDVQLGRYYAGIGGLNIPPQILQNTGALTTLGRASLVAERIYRGDPQAASRFTQAYVQTGDAGRAFQIAGPPRDNPRITVQQVYDADAGVVRYLGIQTTGPGAGTAREITMAPQGAQQPAQGAPAAPAAAAGPTGEAAPAASPGPQAGRPVTGAPKPVSGGRVADRDLAFKYALMAGASQQEAAAVASRTAIPPGKIADIYIRMQKLVGEDFNVEAAQKPAEIAKRMETMFGPDWQQRMRGGGQAAAPAAPSLPPAQADDGIVTVQTPEEARALPPGTRFRTPDGRVKRVP